MRILFYQSGADLYGSSRSLLRLAGRLVRDGHAVKVVFPADGPLVPALRGEGVEAEVAKVFPLVERFVFRSPVGILKFLCSLPLAVFGACSTIRRFRPDIVHSNTSVIPFPAVATRLLRVRHVWHIRETYVEFGAFWRFYRRYMRYGSDVVVAVSTPIARQFPELPQVRVIHNGLPLSEAVPAAPERLHAFREKFNLGAARLVGLVGRIKYVRKGQEILVDAAAELKPRFPGVRFLLVGSPYPGNELHLERLRERIRERGVEDTVVYTGDVADINAVYGVLDISVLASQLPEPFGGVVIESMAHGLPVVGTAIGGTLEQIADGETGILVPPGDAGAMAEAIARLLEDDALRERMGKAARRRYERCFEFEQFYERVTSLYREVAGHEPKEGMS